MSTPIQILNNAAEAVAWLRSRVQGDLQTDSRKVKAGDAFVAWPGAATDGRAYVGKALEQGAAAVLEEADGLQAFAPLMEAMQKQYDESKKRLEQRFLDKVEKLQRGDELPPGETAMAPKGATGWGVMTLDRLVRDRFETKA